MKKIILLFLTFFTLYGEYGDWLTLTFPGKGTDMVKVEDNLVLSSMGVLLVKGNGKERIIDSDDGLFNPNIIKLSYDFRDVLWCLHPNGSISLYNIDTQEFSYLTDFSESGEYEAYDIFSSDKYVYVSTTSNLIRYRFDEEYNKYIVDENNTQFEDPNIFVEDQVVYMFNNQQLKVIDENSSNFNISFWNDIELPVDLVINDIILHNGEIIFLTKNGLYKRDGNLLVKIDGALDKNYIAGCSDSNLYLVASEDSENNENALFETDLNSLTKITNIGAVSSSSFIKEGSNFILNSFEDIFFVYNGEEMIYPEFNLPKLGNMSNMAFTGEGKIVYTNNKVVSYFNAEDNNFLFNSVNLQSGSIRNVYVDRNNSIYIGTWGSGFFNLEIDNDGKLELLSRFNFHDGNNSTYSASPNIIGEGGNLYFVNFGYSSFEDSNLITKIDTESPDSTVTGFNIGSMVYGHELFIDSNNWLWVGSNNEAYQPLPGTTIGIKDLNGSDICEVSLELAIMSIAEDKNKVIWIGTTDGVYYIDLKQVNSPSSISASMFKKVENTLSDSWVNDVVVNNLNEKWFATNNGVSVLSGDNKSWRYYFPLDNYIPEGLSGEIIEGPMLESKVRKILFDDEKNLAIFLYGGGFSFLNYSGVTKDKDIDQLITNPSPFLNNGSSVMQFVLPDVKTYDSFIIYDLRGKVVRGGMGSKRVDLYNGWNGRDNSGNIVSTGIYQVLVYDSNDPVKHYKGKIAVVRK
ncbi:MAG: hypothetical protein CR982_00370 [Candidatus Cloacimonadota bacterium]|nr:MAG: hypothetical protein CR982_00370 [Candidatus Cloacimonadota bacterium]PIE78755.1 MAG: hypothetical protein CSA15_06130 [Candidatus Delongbacteria bacterium]